MSNDLSAEAAEFARPLVHGGFTSAEDVAVAITEYLEPDVSFEDARAVVARLWAQRLAEQESWPAVTDPDRLLTAFSALERRAIVARAGFACCQNCGFAEIGDEAGPEDRGFEFFHEQDTAHVAEGEALLLSYEPLTEAAVGTAEVGREVVSVLEAHDLRVEWEDRRRSGSRSSWSGGSGCRRADHRRETGTLLDVRTTLGGGNRVVGVGPDGRGT
ncbi:hypothetical protein [Amycolatopsis sp. FDAARGOS 1241]|uniref:DUF6891 domain-containing protein n=1 Tax=Amycolatopsis sp. FDAARGOS 1241 TaxID=2778070 RepID=UPI001951D9B2|nr:hypothetical protein [Amycolatopsis sp. FDAARGOS 1241]QRP47749.1 hypothetical protein I6J71_07450 [Amycolatopsis sp. FDAARGOS 1241]